MNSLWIDFVNSDWRDPLGRDPDTDRLDDPQWLRQFLQDAGLPLHPASRPEARKKLQQLRTLIQGIVTSSLQNGSLTSQQLEAFNQYLSETAVRPKLVRADSNYRLELRPVEEGLAAVEFAIAASLANYLVEGDISRLKLCENPHCRWLFVDQTRSQTRRWCAASCGNLIKVRQFRNRERSKRPKKTAKARRSNRRPHA